MVAKADEGSQRGRAAALAASARLLGRRSVLWAAFAAALVPLVVLLALQYSWLVDLERSSTIARHAALENYLEAVDSEVHYFYAKNAERALNVPATLLSEETLPKVAQFFRKKKVDGARRLFVVSYFVKEALLVFDPETVTMSVPEWSPETLAIWAAIAPWKYQHKKGGVFETTALSVDERDPDYRIILNPITDERSKLVGLAGMVVDQQIFEDAVLPKAIAKALPDAGERDKLVVIVRDSHGRRVHPGSSFATTAGNDLVTRSFGFVFTDWKISLGGGGTATPEQWARSNFALNVSLSVALAAVLLGGVALALRTASREHRLSQMKSEFVSNVSHELRTPVASIRVFGELMRRGRVQDPEKVRSYGEYIETESRRLTQLINNILDFSRIESGRKLYSFEPADLEEVVAETVSSFSVRLRNTAMRIDFHGPEHELPEMEIDAAAIDQAVANLLDNAIKYSNGGTEVLVTLERRGEYAVVSVTDHGIGIPRHEQARIFERFHRVSTGLVHDVKGSGLGLALVDHIVRAHGGEVRVTSTPGEGSTFTIMLPVAPLGHMSITGGEAQ
jgi:signal transduction histidine kinase